MNLDRFLALSGKNPQQQTLDRLTADLAKINEQYARAINDVKAGKQINEGIFSAIKAAITTVGKVGAAGANAVANKVKELSSAVKNLYLDAKAKQELKDLIAGLKAAIADFEKLETKVPTILDRDEEVKKEIDLFKDLFAKTIESLSARLASAEGVKEALDIKDLLIAEGVLLEGNAMQDANALQYVIVKDLGRDVKVKNGKLHVTGYANEGEEKAGAAEITDQVDKLKKAGKIKSSVNVANDHANKTVVLTLSEAVAFKVDKSKDLMDNLEKFIGSPLKVGRMTIKGFPVDVEDGSPEEGINMNGVDAEANRELVKLFKAAKFDVSVAADKSFNVDHEVDMYAGHGKNAPDSVELDKFNKARGWKR